jgi:hypothetical protein
VARKRLLVTVRRLLVHRAATEHEQAGPPGLDRTARARARTTERRVARRRRKLARLRRRTRAKVGVVTRKLGIHEQVKRVVQARELRRRPASPDSSALIAATVERVRSAGRPVVVGPWIGEVGFEVLYWLPYLRWLTEHHRVDTSRWIVVSRGGTQSWYGDLAGGGYADALSVLSPDEFRTANEARWREVGSQKQRYDSDVEELLLDQLHAQGAIPEDYELLHPSSMYQAFWHHWKQSSPTTLVQRCTRYTALPPPPLPPGLELPDEFAAVKWYFRPSLPDTPANRTRLRDITSAVADRLPVVLLHENPSLDDHAEADLSDLPGVRAVLGDVPPERNLEVQAAIIARASEYVGTYGGLGYVPMTYGVPSRLYASDMAPLSAVHVRTGHFAAATLGVAHSLVDLGAADDSAG